MHEVRENAPRRRRAGLKEQSNTFLARRIPCPGVRFLAAPRARLAAVLLLALSLGFAGCVEIVAARVPDRLLEGPGGNGWEKNLTASQGEPDSASFGFQKTQSLAYEDQAEDGHGYAGALVVSTLRAVPSPSGDRIREHIQQAIRDQAEAKGITISGDPRTGERTLANGMRASWFVYSGNVSTSGFFSRNAEVKIFGEVFECHEHRTIVATVGLAQVTDERRVGSTGLLDSSTRDTTTWRELVADPVGSIEGFRGSEALAYNVQC